MKSPFTIRLLSCTPEILLELIRHFPWYRTGEKHVIFDGTKMSNDPHPDQLPAAGSDEMLIRLRPLNQDEVRAFKESCFSYLQKELPDLFEKTPDPDALFSDSVLTRGPDTREEFAMLRALEIWTPERSVPQRLILTVLDAEIWMKYLIFLLIGRSMNLTSQLRWSTYEGLMLGHIPILVSPIPSPGFQNLRYKRDTLISTINEIHNRIQINEQNLYSRRSLIAAACGALGESETEELAASFHTMIESDPQLRQYEKSMLDDYRSLQKAADEELVVDLRMNMARSQCAASVDALLALDDLPEEIISYLILLFDHNGVDELEKIISAFFQKEKEIDPQFLSFNSTIAWLKAKVLFELYMDRFSREKAEQTFQDLKWLLEHSAEVPSARALEQACDIFAAVLSWMVSLHERPSIPIGLSSLLWAFSEKYPDSAAGALFKALAFGLPYLGKPGNLDHEEIFSGDVLQDHMASLLESLHDHADLEWRFMVIVLGGLCAMADLLDPESYSELIEPADTLVDWMRGKDSPSVHMSDAEISLSTEFLEKIGPLLYETPKGKSKYVTIRKWLRAIEKKRGWTEAQQAHLFLVVESESGISSWSPSRRKSLRTILENFAWQHPVQGLGTFLLALGLLIDDDQQKGHYTPSLPDLNLQEEFAWYARVLMDLADDDQIDLLFDPLCFYSRKLNEWGYELSAATILEKLWTFLEDDLERNWFGLPFKKMVSEAGGLRELLENPSFNPFDGLEFDEEQIQQSIIDLADFDTYQTMLKSYAQALLEYLNLLALTSSEDLQIDLIERAWQVLSHIEIFSPEDQILSLTLWLSLTDLLVECGVINAASKCLNQVEQVLEMMDETFSQIPHTEETSDQIQLHILALRLQLAGLAGNSDQQREYAPKLAQIISRSDPEAPSLPALHFSMFDTRVLCSILAPEKAIESIRETLNLVSAGSQLLLDFPHLYDEYTRFFLRAVPIVIQAGDLTLAEEMLSLLSRIPSEIMEKSSSIGFYTGEAAQYLDLARSNTEAALDIAQKMVRLFNKNERPDIYRNKSFLYRAYCTLYAAGNKKQSRQAEYEMNRLSDPDTFPASMMLLNRFFEISPEDFDRIRTARHSWTEAGKDLIGSSSSHSSYMWQDDYLILSQMMSEFDTVIAEGMTYTAHPEHLENADTLFSAIERERHIPLFLERSEFRLWRLLNEYGEELDVADYSLRPFIQKARSLFRLDTPEMKALFRDPREADKAFTAWHLRFKLLALCLYIARRDQEKSLIPDLDAELRRMIKGCPARDPSIYHLDLYLLDLAELFWQLIDLPWLRPAGSEKSKQTKTARRLAESILAQPVPLNDQSSSASVKLTDALLFQCSQMMEARGFFPDLSSKMMENVRKIRTDHARRFPTM